MIRAPGVQRRVTAGGIRLRGWEGSKYDEHHELRNIFPEHVGDNEDASQSGVGIHDEGVTPAIGMLLQRAHMTVGNCHCITQSILWSVFFSLSTSSDQPCLPSLILVGLWALPLRYVYADGEAHTVGGSPSTGYKSPVSDLHFG